MTDDLRTRAREAAEEECDIHPGPGMRRVLAAVTRAAFESIDVDELARALHDAACTCDGTTHTPQWWENRERSARAVVAHLTKGDENDE